MATFKVCIFEHHRRSDGKYPVSIGSTGGGEPLHPDRVLCDRQTDHPQDPDPGGRKGRKTIEVKDPYVLKQMGARIAYYESLKSEKLGYKIYIYINWRMPDFCYRHRLHFIAMMNITRYTP